GDAVQFDNNTTLSSGTVEYLWNFGDGSSSVLINPAHTYATFGTYNVTLTATTNYGYTHVANLSVTVNENPTAEFGATNVCEGTVTPFTDGSTIPSGTPSYEWNFGDGSALGSGSNPTHQYATPGVYEVTMTVTADGCSDMASNYVTYAPRAVPDFTPSATTCNSDEVSFTNGTTISSGQVGYLWDFGDNLSSTQENTSHTYGIFGTIDVTLTVTSDFGCVDMITKQINLIEAPKADFTTSLLCDKDNVDFMNATVEPGAAITTYEWAFSDGASFSTKDVSRNFQSIGSYTVTLKAFADNGCLNEVTKTISVDEEPVAEFYAEDVCEGTDAEFANASSGNAGNFTNAWDFGTAGSSTDFNPSATLPLGSTDVTLTVTTPSGCASTVTKTVNVNPLPMASSVVVASGEKGDGTFTVNATVTPADANYVIFWGDGGRASGTASAGTINEIYTYLADGKFNVEVRLEKNGCSVDAK
ncbi:MAG: PKD domain-containing protein, partial [Bacteroidia bacterium]